MRAASFASPLANGSSVSLSRRQKISLNRLCHGRVINIRLLSFVSSRPKNLVHDIPGLAMAQLLLQRIAYEIDEFLGYVGVIPDLTLVCNTAKDLAEMCVQDRANLDLGLNPAQETRVYQFGRIHIGSKDNQHLERNLEFLSSRESQKVDPPVERYDPAVEQLFGANPLPSEIVDDQHP